MVSRPLLEHIETIAGPHTIDPMALDCNAQCSRHHTPFPTPCSTSSSKGHDEKGYLFPPAFLIGPALQHIRETGATVTLLVPDIFPRPYWWPILCHSSGARHLLARLLLGPPEHTASQNQNTCHFCGTCEPSESLEQIPIESCRVLHLLSAAPAALHSLETCPSSGMAQMSCPK